MPSSTPVSEPLPLPLAGEPAWVAQVLEFWFGELGPSDWFGGDGALDARIRARFGALHDALHARLAEGPVEPPGGSATPATDEVPVAPVTPRELLASVLVLDQFSRQLYRGQARAFDSDATARRLAGDAIDAGLDAGFAPAQRLFFYLPFEHSENLADQDRALALTRALVNAGWTDFADRHRALIARFGRFPHRNAALGRTSTPEELAALAEPGNAF
jgi:uncharacterized protein (DUF924 family)